MPYTAVAEDIRRAGFQLKTVPAVARCIRHFERLQPSQGWNVDSNSTGSANRIKDLSAVLA